MGVLRTSRTAAFEPRGTPITPAPGVRAGTPSNRVARHARAQPVLDQIVNASPTLHGSDGVTASAPLPSASPTWLQRQRARARAMPTIRGDGVACAPGRVIFSSVRVGDGPKPLRGCGARPWGYFLWSVYISPGQCSIRPPGGCRQRAVVGRLRHGQNRARSRSLLAAANVAVHARAVRCRRWHDPGIRR